MAIIAVAPVLGLLLLLQGGAPTPKHTWIADLKARRASLGATELRVEGDVVDIRSTSPTAKFGFYRLIDASDPAGLLIRTNQLPKSGGTLRVRAHLAMQQPPDGSLLLDELERSPLGRRPAAAIVLMVISALSLIILGVLLVRAAIDERRYKIAPPLWLLPEAGPYAKAAPVPTPTPPLKYSPELEEQDSRQRERLKKRKRNLLQLTLGSLALTGVSSTWLLISSPAAAQVPAFIFIEAQDLPIPTAVRRAPGGDTTLALNPMPGFDSAGGGIRPPPPPSANAPAGLPRKRDSAAAKPVTPVGRPTQDTVAAIPPVPVPAPVPQPVPPPPPPPAPDAPPRDPEVERTLATQVLTRAAGRVVDAINSRSLTELTLLIPEAVAGDLDRRERFMKLVKDYSPRATLGGVEGATLAEERGEAKLTLQLSWRGDFGVQRRKTGRFLGLIHRDAAGWQFDGARLLDRLP